MKKFMLLTVCLLSSASCFADSLTANPQEFGFWVKHVAYARDTYSMAPSTSGDELHADLYNGKTIIEKKVMGKCGDNDPNFIDRNLENCVSLQKEAQKPEVNKKITIQTDDSCLDFCSLSNEPRS